MARAVLRLDMDGGADIARSLGQIKGVVRSAQVSMNVEARRGAQERTRIATAEGRAVAAAAKASERARVQSERAASRAVAAEARKREQSEKASARERARAEKEVTKTTETEAKKRTQSEAATAREVEQIAKRSAAARERAEREATRVTTREGRNRTRIAEREGAASRRAWGAGATAVGRAGAQYAGQMHGEIQDSRHRRAGSEHTINSALYQVGVGGAEAAGMRQQVYARARALGIDSGELGSAIAASQTQFNSLAGATPQARQAALNQQLALAELAQSTYQSPAEVMRVAGMLGQQGIHGADQRRSILTMTGMAQAGSIELGSMTREALGPLMQNIARSVNASMTPAQRAAAVQAATVETMAVGEVTAASGGRSRDMLNALAKTRGTIADPRMQERLFARLGHEGHTDLAAQMFSTVNGQHRLRSQNAVGFMSQLVTGFGGNANAAMAALGAGGHGAPMVLDAQQRRLMLLLASQSESGGTIAGRVNDLQAQGARFNEGDVARGRAMVQGEQGTAIAREQETHDSKLTNNTDSLVRLSNTIRDWQVRNPWLSNAAPAAGSLAAAALPALLRGGPGGGGGAGAAVNVATRVGAGAGMGAGAGGALMAAGALALVGLGLGAHESGRQWQRSQRERGTQGDIVGRDTWAAVAPGLGIGPGTAAPGGTPTVTFDDAAAQRLAEAIRRNPITAAISPHDAAHAATVGASGHSPPPPAAR